MDAPGEAAALTGGLAESLTPGSRWLVKVHNSDGEIIDYLAVDGSTVRLSEEQVEVSTDDIDGAASAP